MGVPYFHLAQCRVEHHHIGRSLLDEKVACKGLLRRTGERVRQGLRGDYGESSEHGEARSQSSSTSSAMGYTTECRDEVKIIGSR